MAQLSRQTYLQTIFLGNLTAAVGSSAVDALASDTVDTAGYEGVYFIGSLVHGGTGGAPTFAIRQSTAAITNLTSGGQGSAMGGASATLPTGSSATAEHGAIDVYRPRTGSGARFLFAQWTIPSSCAVLGPAFALLYGPANLGNSTQANSTSVRVIPQTTVSSTATPFLTFGITGMVSGATS